MWWKVKGIGIVFFYMVSMAIIIVIFNFSFIILNLYGYMIFGQRNLVWVDLGLSTPVKDKNTPMSPS